MNSVDTAIYTGVAGVASETLLYANHTSELVQVVTIVCSCLIAITHIVIGYFLYKSQNSKKS
jgi:preprotein translocase subunit SecG